VSWCNGPDTGEGKEGRNPTKVNFFLLKKERKKGKQVSGFSGVVQVQMHIKRVSDLWAKILRVLLYCSL
jgi:hypothetical protein